MINYKPKHGDMELWLIIVAMGGDHTLLDKMNKNEDGSYPVIFSVGGVELNFNRVAKRIEKGVDDLVTQKAQVMINEKYSDLINGISDLQKRIEDHKEIFKYDWEKDSEE